jgi:mRNA-degrading endonuclease RelE of RelBE toxin-antitoxin system
MSQQYTVKYTQRLVKDIKRYNKKFPKLKNDIEHPILDELEQGGLVGTSLDNLNLPKGEYVYKVRAPNSSIKTGKSGRFRVIYYAVLNGNEIFMLSIYSKKDSKGLKDSEIRDLINRLF